MYENLIDKARWVVCPKCHAYPGQPCIDPRTGAEAPGVLSHQARTDEWVRQGRPEVKPLT